MVTSYEIINNNSIKKTCREAGFNSDMKIIVGLGNPGKEYERTAHNAGYMAMDRFTIYDLRITNWVKNNKFKAEIAEVELAREKVLLVKPMTFMNRSGEVVAAVLNFYKLDLADLIVAHDDADLPLGKIKVQKGGGAAGHHGIESIIKAVGEDFVRVRVGVRVDGGKPPSPDKIGIRRAKAVDFILKSFNKEQEKILEEMLEKASEAILTILKEGLVTAMNKYN